MSPARQAARTRARRGLRYRPRRRPRLRAETGGVFGLRGPSSALAREAREVRAEIIRLDVADQPEGAAFAPLRAEECRGRRAVDAEAMEQGLVGLAVGGDIGLQQHVV